ncbi:PrsW family intramembrane metalloprotease [Micromonospora sp. KC723]|uniref:PrsW family intramembrane metalloprotease n=1 Tax=Micromonospora sp. KC723 TaxID=2530381 RepID=UPI001FB59B33|nr:PrsW family glutamic-type intramembrane protease [Micromonospora sp. KC723]
MSTDHAAGHDAAARREDEMTMVSPAAFRPTTHAGTGTGPRARRRLPSWARVFLTGLVLWVVAVPVTFATGNINLIPTIILLGSFLVPVTFVVYVFGRADGVVTAERVFVAFLCGGVLGVLGASILEAALLRQPSGWGYVGVGLIEEAVKLAALWLLARHLPRYTARDGMVLGASVGLGFAALESAGYAFTALFSASGSLSLLNVVETEALRAVLAPFGHGLWTAILGGALFATAARSRHGRPRLGGALLGWYLLMALLHMFWDASSGIAVFLTLLLTGTPTQWTLISLGAAPGVTAAQVHTYTVISWGLLALDAAVGVLILVARWRRTAPPAPVTVT